MNDVGGSSGDVLVGPVVQSSARHRKITSEDFNVICPAIGEPAKARGRSDYIFGSFVGSLVSFGSDEQND